MLGMFRNRLGQFSPAFGDVRHLERYRSSYAFHNLQERTYLNQIGCLISIVIVTLGIPLDWVVYHDHFYAFIVLRLSEDAFLMLIYFATTLPLLRPYLRVLTGVLSSSVILTVCYIIFYTEGAVSPYYAGINLVTLGIGFMLGLTFGEAVFYTLLSVASYLGVSLLAGIPEGAGHIMVNNSYFIFLTGVIAVLAAYFGERIGFYTFAQDQEIQRKNKELEEMDRLKSEFLANISHELRTPLTVIVGPAKQLLHNPQANAEDVQQTLEQIVRNGNRLIKLVNDVLSFVQIDAGREKLNLQPLDFTLLVTSVVEQMRPLFERVGHKTLRFKGVDHAIGVSGDELRLERVLFNLLQNSYKFTEGKQAEIDVEIAELGDLVVLSVHDNGIGIAPEFQQVIFERYRQVDGSQTRRYQGSGIGLALVKDVVERHGGRVSVQSQPQIGTTFRVELPRCNLPVLPSAREAMPDLIRLYRDAEIDYLQTFQSLQQEPPVAMADTCLVLDDEPDMADYLRRLLSPYFRVIVVYDPAQAQQIIRDAPPRLVVTDHMLPGMTGIQWVRWLRNQPEGRDVPVLMVTARDEPVIRQQALDAGVQAFFGKPFDDDVLLLRIKQLLGGQVQQAAEPNSVTLPHLLVVDDEPELLTMLTHGLSAFYTLTAVADGVGALAAARQQRPDLLLLDMMLPGLDGIAVTRQLRADPLMQSVPILMLTANVQDRRKQEALEAGVDDFVTKPFSWPELRARLDGLRKRTQAQHELLRNQLALTQTLEQLRASQARLLQLEQGRVLHLFSSALLHEVGNPLTYALSSARVAQRHIDQPRGREAIADCLDGLQRIQTIMTDLRDFLQDRQDTAPIAVDLAMVVNRALKLHAQELEGIYVEQCVPESLWVSGHSVALLHVFSNLIRNAIQAVNDKRTKGGQLLIALQNPDVSSGTVQIEVTDNGIGIAPDHLPRIFEPLYTTRVKDGLGLGLPTCVTLLQLMGGSIRVESILGQGTHFYLELPVWPKTENGAVENTGIQPPEAFLAAPIV